MSFYGEQIVPRLADLTLRGRPYDRLRARVTADLRGEVLEIGFGSGRNVPYYPATVTRVCAVEPSAVGRKLAADRVADSLVPVEFVGLDGEALPVDDASVDQVLTTWTLCTIPDVARALREVRRVLRRGGAFHFVEHGRAPDPRVARWQDRLTPIQRRLAGGCHLNRPIERRARRSLIASRSRLSPRRGQQVPPAPSVRVRSRPLGPAAGSTDPS